MERSNGRQAARVAVEIMEDVWLTAWGDARSENAVGEQTLHWQYHTQRGTG